MSWWNAVQSQNSSFRKMLRWCSSSNFKVNEMHRRREGFHGLRPGEFQYLDVEEESTLVDFGAVSLFSHHRKVIVYMLQRLSPRICPGVIVHNERSRSTVCSYNNVSRINMNRVPWPVPRLFRLARYSEFEWTVQVPAL
jgi:hypothetical protein